MKQREDLIVHFDLVADDSEDEAYEDENIKSNININSQKDLDILLETQKTKRQKKVMRNLLMLLKQQKEPK